MPSLRDQVWYGTQEAYDAAVLLAERADARLKAAGSLDDGPAPDYLLQKVGNVGVINIRGPLINSDSPIYAFFGVSTYPAICRAVISAAKDSSIEQILLSVDSGGGQVSGVADTGVLLSRVNKKLKPVTTYAGGTMASAAYWLGVSAGKRFASSTSEVGSIGVLSVHLDYTKQMQNEGVTATVTRSGKYKALENPYEPLSELAKQQIQARVDAAYQVFGDHVASSLGMTFAEMDKKIGQGRTFFGQKAADVGLVDGIASFDAVLNVLANIKKR